MSYGSGAYGGSTAMTYACLGVMLGIGVIGFAMTASEEDSRRHEGQLAPGSEGSLLRGETTTAMPGPLASEPGTAATAATAAAAEAEEETECPIITNAEAEANPGAATTKSRCRLYQKAFETWVATLSGDVQSRVTSKWPDLGAAFKQLWAVKLPGGKRFFRSVCDKPDGVVPVIIDSKSPDVQNAILSAIDVADEAGSVQGGPPTAKQMLKWVSKWKLPGFDIAASSASPSLSPPPAAAAPEASADNKPPPTRDDMIGWVKKWSKLPSDFLSFAGVPGTAALPGVQGAAALPGVTLLDQGVAAALSAPSLGVVASEPSSTPGLSDMPTSSNSYEGPFDEPPTTPEDLPDSPPQQRKPWMSLETTTAHATNRQADDNLSSERIKLGLGPNGEPAKGGGRASADAASHHVGGGRRVSSLRKRLHKS